jgi:hypothetical protein
MDRVEKTLAQRSLPKKMKHADESQEARLYNKSSNKTLQQQIDVVAHFHAYKIRPERIAFRTGINLELVNQLIEGDGHQRLFKALLARHRRSRRDQRLQKSRRIKGIAQAELQDQIEKEYIDSLVEELAQPSLTK